MGLCVAFIPGARVPGPLGCSCGGEQGWTQFGPSRVTSCNRCHRLRSVPLVDPRVPSLADHQRCLQEEIAVEEEEARKDQRELRCTIEEAHKTPSGAVVRCQVMEGDPRWVVEGSRLEGAHVGGKQDETTNVRVTKKAGPVLELLVDDPAWADAPRGHAVVLYPATNATLHRNLLKAFLVVSRGGPDEMLAPERLPTIDRAKGTTSGLRPKQAEALERALATPENGVMLVQGPPGTGKTFVIARFIRDAVRRGETVLVTSHTHVAIDNALRKAVKGDRSLRGKLLRLGEAGKVSPDLLPWNAPIGKFHMDPEDEDAVPLFRSIFQDRPVVGMTLDALACALVHVDRMDQPFERFDHVIVDEAGMNGYPKLAIARAAGKRLLLVGDPLQLPPIVRAWSYRDDVHYKRSHFELLQMMRPDLCVMLDEQFRSDPAIYSWSNGAVYDERVQDRREPSGATWRGEGPVVWVDTKGLGRDERVGSSRTNGAHLDVARTIIRDLIKDGFRPEDIGYISPFKAQSVRFQEEVPEQKDAAALSRITASTVDAFQGNERRAILYDLTSMRPGKPHEDHRRLNVSLTRAQDLLIIIGPRDFVRRDADNPYHASLQRWVQAVVRP